MNNLSVSFCGYNSKGPDVPSFVNRKTSSSVNLNSGYSSPRPSFVTTPEGDTYQTKKTPKKTTNKQAHSRKKAPSPISVATRTFLITLAASAGLNLAVAQADKVPATVTVPITPSSSIVELADTYDVDLDAILDFNDISSEADLAACSEIEIPSTFDYLQVEIDELQNKLFDNDLSKEERAEIEDRINQLEDKRELQQAVATVYTDGKYVYYLINEQSEGFSGGINVEVFKDIFDIGDRALRRNNNLDSHWEKDSDNPEDDGYYDYTGNYFYSGETYKVRVNDVEKDDINLNY